MKTLKTILEFGHCDVNSHECSVCTCDDAAILCSDASDSVSVNHNVKML